MGTWASRDMEGFKHGCTVLTLEHEVWKGTVSVRLTYSLGVRRSLFHDNLVPVSFDSAVLL